MSQCPIEGRLANVVDPDQKPQNAASDQALYCLFEIQILFIKYNNNNNNNYYYIKKDKKKKKKKKKNRYSFYGRWTRPKNYVDESNRNIWFKELLVR